MVDASLWFTLGTLGMVLGTVLLVVGQRWIPGRVERRYWFLVTVPAIAVVAYGIMALGIGAIPSARGGTVFLPRYADWLLTTPLHVLYLGLLVGAARSVIGRAMALQAATILLGFAASLVGGVLAWVLYLAGSAAFAGVIYIAFTDYSRAASECGDRTSAVFEKLRAFMIVLWLVYPVVWLLAPAGTGLMDVETTALVVSYLDVVAKVGFGLIALNGQLARNVTDTPHGAVAGPNPDA